MTSLTANPEQEIEAKDLLDQFKKTFPPTQLRIIELWMDGYSISEVAEMTQRTKRTVYTTRKAAERMVTEVVAM